jgi:hypothetical protein
MDQARINKQHDRIGSLLLIVITPFDDRQLDLIGRFEVG